MPEPPGSGGDEPPPAGTASHSDQPGSPADVLHAERDWLPFNPAASKVSKELFPDATYARQSGLFDAVC
jgi:hypothetical protein